MSDIPHFRVGIWYSATDHPTRYFAILELPILNGPAPTPLPKYVVIACDLCLDPPAVVVEDGPLHLDAARRAMADVAGLTDHPHQRYHRTSQSPTLPTKPLDTSALTGLGIGHPAVVDPDRVNQEVAR